MEKKPSFMFCVFLVCIMLLISNVILLEKENADLRKENAALIQMIKKNNDKLENLLNQLRNKSTPRFTPKKQLQAKVNSFQEGAISWPKTEYINSLKKSKA
jgi:hypothetical protein